ncbi:MBL fold metallo-hydrolase [Candidatus Micrarchaeota archaeon]|nr:MBL fold metallo-hydrolase [Candidatus Micrarchaeota archaeon]
MQELADGIHVVYGDEEPLSSNVYVLEGKNAVWLVDSGLNPDRVVSFLSKPVAGVLFTHGHFDHVLGALEAQWPGLMHAGDLRVLEDLNADYADTPKPDFFKPFSGNVLGFDDFALELFHTPGHTPGSVCFLEKNSGILFSGDTKFSHGGVGRTDLWGGNSSALDESLSLLERLDYRLLAPGHGDVQ